VDHLEIAVTIGQMVLLLLAAVTWLGGGNVLVAFHFRRLGEPWWSGFRPFAFPFSAFSRLEWVILALLAVTSLTLMGLAVL
jgi:hypothetical protein